MDTAGEEAAFTTCKGKWSWLVCANHRTVANCHAALNCFSIFPTKVCTDYNATSHESTRILLLVNSSAVPPGTHANTGVLWTMQGRVTTRAWIFAWRLLMHPCPLKIRSSVQLGILSFALKYCCITVLQHMQYCGMPSCKKRRYFM